MDDRQGIFRFEITLKYRLHILSVMKTTDSYNDTLKRYRTLSCEEESRLIEEHGNDDIKLRDLLFYHNIRYALSVASEYKSLGNVHGGEDCVQNAILGLYKASRNYDTSAGTKFTTYATYYIRREILYFTRLTENNVSENSISMNKKVSSHDNDDIREFSDVIQRYVEPTMSIGCENGVDDYENMKNVILHVLHSSISLPKRHQDMFSEYYLSSERPSIDYMMDRFRISRRRVTQILKEAKDDVVERLARFFPKELFVKYGIDNILTLRDEPNKSIQSARYSHVNYEKLAVKREAKFTRTSIRWRPDYMNDKIHRSKPNVKQTDSGVNDLNDASDMIERNIHDSECGMVFDEEAHFVD